MMHAMIDAAPCQKKLGGGGGGGWVATHFFFLPQKFGVNFPGLMSKGWVTGAGGERGGNRNGRTISRQLGGGGGGLSRKGVLSSLLYQPFLIFLNNFFIIFFAATWFLIFLKFKMVW